MFVKICSYFFNIYIYRLNLNKQIRDSLNTIANANDYNFKGLKEMLTKVEE